MKRALLVVITLLAPALVYAGAGLHQDPIAPVILGVTGILFFAVIGRFGARKLGQPSVLGELIMGVLLGNLAYWLGFDFIEVLREGPAIFDMLDHLFAQYSLQEAGRMAFGAENAPRLLAILETPAGPEYLQVAHIVDIFSRYGVIFLLFLVGLETSVQELNRVGGDSLRVAITGLALPFGLGFAVARLMMPEQSLNVDLFAAATLGATSIGITARVLLDLGKMQTREARVVLGAAVMDDILGLVLLSVVSGIVVSGGVDMGNIIMVLLLSALFLLGAFLLGPLFLNFTIRLLRHMDLAEAKLFISFLFVMLLAWLANLAGLATIVGAFAAGVILHDGYFTHWGEPGQHKHCIKDLVAPLEAILVPIFFVLMGIEVKLETFLHWDVVILALGLLAAAIVGKVASGWAARHGVNHLAVGIGMLPRGEVGLIFAAIGKSLGVINDSLFSAVVMMVIITTVMTPPLLKRVMGNTPDEVRD